MVDTEEAKQMQNGINIKGKIENKGEIRTVHRKKDGVEVKVCDAYLADKVGRIKLTLWAEDAEKVKNGDCVSVQGAYTTTFRSEVKLNVSKKNGRLEVISDDNCKDGDTKKKRKKKDDDPAMTDNYSAEDVKEIQLRKNQREQTYDGTWSGRDNG